MVTTHPGNCRQSKVKKIPDPSPEQKQLWIKIKETKQKNQTKNPKTKNNPKTQPPKQKNNNEKPQKTPNATKIPTKHPQQNNQNSTYSLYQE